MKQCWLTAWTIIFILPFLVAQELTLLEPSDIRAPQTSTNPLLEYVLADDTLALCDLLSEGMNPNYVLEDGQTALHYTQNPGIAALLIEYGADVNAKDDFHNSPLHHAVSNLNQPLTRLLLEEGADANIQNKSYYTPLLQCLEEPEQEALRANIAQLLLEHGANPNVSTQLYQNTPLYFAVQAQNQQAVIALLVHEANPNDIQGEAGAPLDLASKLADTTLIHLLKGAGATHLRLREDLLQAMYENNNAQISTLVTAGLELNFKFEDIQLSPLQAAIKYMQSATIVQLFLEQGALPDFMDTLTNSPLHLAIDTKSELPVIELLVAHGADLNTVDINGKSVLYKAVELENQPLITLLLKYGADPAFIVNDQTILDLAKDTENIDLIKLFEQDGEN